MAWKEKRVLNFLKPSEIISISINYQWRIVFHWDTNATYDVQVMDYYKQMSRFMIPSNRTATHPGIILLTEFLEPLKLTKKVLAMHVDTPVQMS